MLFTLISTLAFAGWQERADEARSTLDQDLVSQVMTQPPRQTRAGFLKFASGPIMLEESQPVVLHRLAEESDPAVRIALAGVLTQHIDSWGDAIMALLQNEADPQVRMALLYGFKRADAALAGDAIGLAMADADAEVRAEAVRIMGWRKDGGWYAGQIQTALSDESAVVRAAAARSAGWLRLDVADALVGLVADPEAEVRYQALNALARVAPERAGALPNLENLRRDPDLRVSRVADRVAKP